MTNIIQYILSFGNVKAMLRKELSHLRDQFDNVEHTLVPIDHGELKHLAFHHAEVKRFSKQKYFTLTSIYNEHFVAYKIKNVGKENQVIIAQTHGTEYCYITYNGTTEVYIDEAPFARILSNGQIKDMRNRTVGSFHRMAGTSFRKLNIHDHDVAAIQIPEKMGLLSRVYQNLSTETANDEKLTLAVTLPYIINTCQKFIKK